MGGRWFSPVVAGLRQVPAKGGDYVLSFARQELHGDPLLLIIEEGGVVVAQAAQSMMGWQPWRMVVCGGAPPVMITDEKWVRGVCDTERHLRAKGGVKGLTGDGGWQCSLVMGKKENWWQIVGLRGGGTAGKQAGGGAHRFHGLVRVGEWFRWWAP
jgi:hypothetical protein